MRKKETQFKQFAAADGFRQQIKAKQSLLKNE